MSDIPFAAMPTATLASLAKPSAAVIRDELLDLVRRDLEGPAGGPEEQIDPAHFPMVHERYVVGTLAPRGLDLNKMTGGLDDLAATVTREGDDGHETESAQGAPAFLPSSFGLSCTIASDVEAIAVTAAWGRYEKVDIELADASKKRVWQRFPFEARSHPIPLVEGRLKPWQPSAEQPEVVVTGITRRRDDLWVVSVFLVNRQEPRKRDIDEAWLFQVRLEVEGVDESPIFVRRLIERDADRIDPLAWHEERMLQMAYRHIGEFATGHGTAVHAELAAGDPARAVRVVTRSIPRYDVPKTDVPSASDNPDLAGPVLDMKALAEAATPAVLAAMLVPLADAYAHWIAHRRADIDDPASGLEPFRTARHDAPMEAINQCEAALTRIRLGIALLQTSPQAFEAFRFANQAMALQRVRSLYAERRRRGESVDLAAVDTPANHAWRPFQLAFILLNLPSITDLKHPERSDKTGAVADLLWFPTGGGKTEAYLGLASYAMALRRLQGVVAGRDGRAGVAVLMRYTLRLLTIQQFQRAAALICACELLRRDSTLKGENGGAGRWGDEPFRIGLWVGQKTTPNWVDDADEAIRQERGAGEKMGFGAGSPAQLTHCPWCGSRIEAGRDIEVETEAKGRLRVVTYCSDRLGRCEFSRPQSPGEGIPAMVVDEEIYRRLPTLLIATVDKFAQMAWRGETQMLFGRVDKFCPRHGYRNPSVEDTDSHPKRGHLGAVKSQPVAPLRPPDLIIQDELHLISGPLGTLVGLYETAIDTLCTWEVDGVAVRPKVIASTATVRQAKDQIWGLFMRQIAVFPPQGLDARDNFFAVQRPTSAVPGRAYLGVCAPGRRLKKVLIRVYTAFLAAAQFLYESKGYGVDADPWMTLVGYFNSMRELGGMRRLVDDDIRQALRDTDKRGLTTRKAPIVEELTSRKRASEIPEMLDRMEVCFDPAIAAARKQGGAKNTPYALDVLLATNMVSVGVDVKRLGLMVVAGQPKTTAEYIQATSRVGREKPGIVCSVYNWARPRDLSHYERFEHYHATFYQHVEGLSVTPFAPRAVQRGITGVLVSLIRDLGFEYNANSSAHNLDRSRDLVQAALQAILERENSIAEGHARVDDLRAMLERRIDDWLNLVVRRQGSRLGYVDARDGVTKGFLEKPRLGPWTTFTCLNSLREVEPTAGLILNPAPIFDELPPEAEVVNG